MKILQKIFYGLALLFIPLAIILDRIGDMPQPLLFFLAAAAIFPLAAVCAGFLAASDLAGGHKVGVSVAHAATPKGFIEIFTWKGKVDRNFLTGMKNACGRGILKLARRRRVKYR